MKIETYIVDSFTDTLFAGNPAGVCLLQEDLPEARMLSIAQELNLSETAFVRQKGPNQYSIRFFSPKMEIPLCGHATLASAKIIASKQLEAKAITFTNIDGLELPVTMKGEHLTMEFPVYATHPTEVGADMLAALGIGSIKHAAFNKELAMVLLELADSRDLRSLTPDFQALVKTHSAIRGVLITAASKLPEYDFESRYFWPWSGSDEDPVTGATHTFLVKYWSDKTGKTKMKSYQCSARGGFMDVELKEGKLYITSEAKIVLEGSLTL